jgi:hypothetical protein
MPEINIDNQTKESNLFFTTSDLINKINKVVDKEHEKSNDGSENHPRFELQRRFADGTTRKASTEEAAANDFQSKLKQVRQLDCVSHFGVDRVHVMILNIQSWALTIFEMPTSKLTRQQWLRKICPPLQN